LLEKELKLLGLFQFVEESEVKKEGKAEKIIKRRKEIIKIS
jgi:hypothetical protein